MNSKQFEKVVVYAKARIKSGQSCIEDEAIRYAFERIYELESKLYSLRNHHDSIIFLAIKRVDALEAALSKIHSRIEAKNLDEWSLEALKSIASEALSNARRTDL